MHRRAFLAGTGVAATAAIAGCLGWRNSTSKSPTKETVTLSFTNDGGQVVITHSDGVSLPSERTVYVMVNGTRVHEARITNKVSAGDELVRTPRLEDEFHQSQQVSVYLENDGENDQELGSQEVAFATAPPQATISFDYAESHSQMTLFHDAGDAITEGTLRVQGDVTDEAIHWNAPVDGEGTTVTVAGEIARTDVICVVQNLPDNPSIDLVWESENGIVTQKLGSYTSNSG